MSSVTILTSICSSFLTHGIREGSTSALLRFTTMHGEHRANRSSGYLYQADAGGLTGSARGGVDECRVFSNSISRVLTCELFFTAQGAQDSLFHLSVPLCCEAHAHSIRN